MDTAQTRVLWFSRHFLDEDQLNGLKAIYGSNLVINQVDRTVKHVSEIQDEIDNSDVIAIVAPLDIQQQFLQLAGERPVILSESKRMFSDDGGKTVFKFNGWIRIKEIVYRTERLN